MTLSLTPRLRIAIATVAGFLLTTCTARPPVLEQVLTTGELHVITRNAPTTYYYGPDGETGLEYDLARLFAERLGVELRIQVASTVAAVFPPLIRGDVHIAAAGLTITASRLDRVRFGPPYQEVVQQIAYRYGTGRPRNPGDLVGGRFEVVAGSSHSEHLARLIDEFPELTWSENRDAEREELLHRVAEGLIDYTIADSTELQLTQRYYPEIRAAFDISDPEPLAWALAPGDDRSLLDEVERFFEQLRDSGTLEQLIDKYYAHVDRFDYVGTRVLLRHISVRLPEYEQAFREAAAEVGVDWRLLAAIGYQESHWNPRAVSPTGVRGIMMLTLNTAEYIGIENRLNPRESIFGGARYFASLRSRLPARIREPDRTWLALAAYNIGLGHLEDARVITQRQGGDPDSWTDVREHLPKLAQRRYFEGTRYGYARGREPVIYVDNVRSYYDVLAWLRPDPIDTAGIDPVPAPALDKPPL